MNAIMAVAMAGVLVAQADYHIPLCDGECQVAESDAMYKVDEVEGTLEYPALPTFQAGWTMMARMTAYTHTGNRTRTGTYPRWGTVAVDPRVIPLGSRLLIEGFPGTVFIAEDTGGGVRGNHIDIFMNTYGEAIRFGVQQRRVTVLR